MAQFDSAYFPVYRGIFVIIGGLLVAILLWIVSGVGQVVRAEYREMQQDVRDQVLGINDYAMREYEYELVKGWNFVAFPFEPSLFATAHDMAIDIALAGGYVSTISYWDGDRWVDVSFRGDQVYGHDYKIEPGVAYFVRNHEQVTWNVRGRSVPRALRYVRLQPGWNAVGFFQDGMPVEQLIDEVNRGRERVVEVDRWDTGIWDPFVKRLYSREDIQTYGNNFEIELNRGYFVQSKEQVVVSSIK